MKYKRQKTKVSEYISHTQSNEGFPLKSRFKKQVRASIVLVVVMFLISGFGIVKRPVIKNIFGHSGGLSNVFSAINLQESRFLKAAGESIFNFCFGYLKQDTSKTSAYAESKEKPAANIHALAEEDAKSDSAPDIIAEAVPLPDGRKEFNPIWPCKGDISSEYGTRIHPVSGQSKFHGGIDIAVDEGTKIVACEDGTVSVSEFNEFSGNYVVISHCDGYTSSYLHMVYAAVSKGAQIKQGDIVGYAGSTGIATGPHLHFEIKKDGNLTDPRGLLNTD